MRLAKMRPKARIQNDFDLGSHDMNQNYDWMNAEWQNYTIENIAIVSDFIQQALSLDGNKSNEIKSNENENDLIDF